MKTSKYIKIPNAILSDEQVGKNEILVYVALSYFRNNKMNKVSPSVATIAKLARLAESTTRIALKQLEELGYISVQRQYEQGTGAGKTNLYTFLKEEI